MKDSVKIIRFKYRKIKNKIFKTMMIKTIKLFWKKIRHTIKICKTKFTQAFVAYAIC